MRNSEGGFAGLDVDVATYVAQRLGTGARDITFVEARPADRETLLEQNKVDLVLEQQPSYREWVDALLKGDTRRGQVTSALRSMVSDGSWQRFVADNLGRSGYQIPPRPDVSDSP